MIAIFFLEFFAKIFRNVRERFITITNEQFVRIFFNRSKAKNFQKTFTNNRTNVIKMNEIRNLLIFDEIGDSSQ